MTGLPGRWALTMRTPIGSIEAEMTFTDHGGALSGTARGKAETVPLTEVRSDAIGDSDDGGEHVTWHQSITRPMRLNLVFDVVVRGDVLQGHSRAGRLPRSPVSGSRILD